MKEKFIFVIIVVVLGYGVYNFYQSKKKENLFNAENIQRSNKQKKHFLSLKEAELAYIIDVINNGSNRLNYQKEGMEGGFIPKEKAFDVACYTLELSGKKCNKKYAKDAALYFSSVCASCHGRDGKGINGKFPNLTKFPLEGLQRWLDE